MWDIREKHPQRLRSCPGEVQLLLGMWEEKCHCAEPGQDGELMGAHQLHGPLHSPGVLQHSKGSLCCAPVPPCCWGSEGGFGNHPWISVSTWATALPNMVYRGHLLSALQTHGQFPQPHHGALCPPDTVQPQRTPLVPRACWVLTQPPQGFTHPKGTLLASLRSHTRLVATHHCGLSL